MDGEPRCLKAFGEASEDMGGVALYNQGVPTCKRKTGPPPRRRSTRRPSNCKARDWKFAHYNASISALVVKAIERAKQTLRLNPNNDDAAQFGLGATDAAAAARATGPRAKNSSRTRSSRTKGSRTSRNKGKDSMKMAKTRRKLSASGWSRGRRAKGRAARRPNQPRRHGRILESLERRTRSPNGARPKATKAKANQGPLKRLVTSLPSAALRGWLWSLLFVAGLLAWSAQRTRAGGIGRNATDVESGDMLSCLTL